MLFHLTKLVPAPLPDFSIQCYSQFTSRSLYFSLLLTIPISIASSFSAQLYELSITSHSMVPQLRVLILSYFLPKFYEAINDSQFSSYTPYRSLPPPPRCTHRESLCGVTSLVDLSCRKHTALPFILQESVLLTRVSTWSYQLLQRSSANVPPKLLGRSCGSQRVYRCSRITPSSMTQVRFLTSGVAIVSKQGHALTFSRTYQHRNGSTF